MWLVRGFEFVVAFSVMATLSACSKPASITPAGRSAYSAMRTCLTRTQVDNFADGLPRAMVSDGAQTLWVAGSGLTAGVPNSAVVRKSSNSGLTWATVDQDSGSEQKGAENRAIALAPQNTVYLGQWVLEKDHQTASVRVSSDGGTTWKSTSFRLHAGNEEAIKGITLSPSGIPYFLGVSKDPQGKQTSFILKGADLQLVNEWTDGVVNQLIFTPKEVVLNEKSVDENATVNETLMAVGSVGTHWVTKKSLDGGKTWLPLDDFAQGTSATANSVLFLNQGSFIDVAGEVTDAKGVSWFIRQTQDGGKTWKFIDTFKSPEYKTGRATQLINFLGTPVALGTAQDFNGQYHWNVRMSDGATGSKWQTIVSFKASADTEAQATALAATGAGELVVAGESRDADAQPHWVVMKLNACH